MKNKPLRFEKNTSNYFQVVPNSWRPMPEDVKKLAYFFWLNAGGNSVDQEQFYYKAENSLKNWYYSHNSAAFGRMLEELRAL